MSSASHRRSPTGGEVQRPLGRQAVLIGLALALLGLWLAPASQLGAAPLATPAGGPQPAAETPASGQPTASATPTASPTATPSPTPTPTPTRIVPTPTAARPTPHPSGYFVAVYQGQIQAPGLESSLIRGRVVDYRGDGISSFPVAGKTSGVSYSTVTGLDGSYAIGGLKPGFYSVAVTGYPHTPADGIFLAARTVLSVDFVEAVRPGSVPEASESETGVRSGQEDAPPAQPTVLIVVLTPEGGSTGGSSRPTPTLTPFRPGQGPDDLELEVDGLVQAFVVGLGAATGLVALGIVASALRR